MARVKLTKNELKGQKDALKRFQRYLPTLQLKKQQLQMVIRQVEIQMLAKDEQRTSLEREVEHTLPAVHLMEVAAKAGVARPVADILWVRTLPFAVAQPLQRLFADLVPGRAALPRAGQHLLELVLGVEEIIEVEAKEFLDLGVAPIVREEE